jgi:hypothetical protein
VPRIFDNIEKELLPALQETLDAAYKADFCVGYFNLRGWKCLDSVSEASATRQTMLTAFLELEAAIQGPPTWIDKRAAFC